MGLNSTPSSERVHIGFFGLRNAGKSSLVNAVTGQEMAVISDVKGTTTDPVRKAMEILPIGPVVIIDTPGFDDEGKLGELRVKTSKRVLARTDVAVLVCDASKGFQPCDLELIELFKEREIPYVIAFNKADLLEDKAGFTLKDNEILVSALKKESIYELKELIAKLTQVSEEGRDKVLIGDLVEKNSMVVLVVPIDKAAPKGRIILPQQQTIRDLLDHGAVSVVCRESELADTLEKLAPKKPDLVVTDSQAFREVSKIVPEDILLTSFSILFARYKGNLERLVGGATTISKLEEGDSVLISEGCTHHRQCGDIGTEKLPKLIKKFTGKEFNFEFSSGNGFPEDLSKYKLVIHCGGCMLNEREMQYRMEEAQAESVPMTNYGVAIAYMNGILERSLKVFGKDMLK